MEKIESKTRSESHDLPRMDPAEMLVRRLKRLEKEYKTEFLPKLKGI